MCFLLTGTTFAQNKITTNDEIVIRRKAIGLVKDLEYLYNQLLAADSDDRNIIIDNKTLPTDGNISTFVNDQVLIEDDFQTRENKSNDIPTKKVDIYFKELCSSYGKQDNGDFVNENKSIVFSNITTSKTMAISTKDPLFIKVFFEINYNGIDNRTSLPFKQPSKRVVEFSISKIKNNWSLAIQTLRFLREPEEDFSSNVIVEKVAITPDLQSSIKVDETKIIFKNPVIQAFRIDDKWGIKNLNENEKLLSAPNFDEIENYSEDDGLALVNIGGLWGYIDKDGKIVIKCEYDNADSFSKEKKGRAKVFKGMESFFIDKNGSRIK